MRNIHMTGQWCQMVSDILPSHLRFIIREEKRTSKKHTPHTLTSFVRVLQDRQRLFDGLVDRVYGRCDQFRFGFSSFYVILFLFP